MIDWNVIVTVRQDFDRAISLLRRLGAVERTDLYNVILMHVPDVHALLEQIAQRPEEDGFLATISHVIPITDKVPFATAEELELNLRAVVRTWLPELAGKAMHVRVRRRGHKGELHGVELEQRIAQSLLDELDRRGTPGRIALDDPDVVIAIETIRDEAGLALWTHADLERYPFLRASIERGADRHAAPASRESAPSRRLVAATARVSAGHPATASEIVELLGEIEPLTVQKLVATHATIEEVAEAVSAIEDEATVGEVHHAPATTREAAVRAILEALMFESFEEWESEREIART